MKEQNKPVIDITDDKRIRHTFQYVNGDTKHCGKYHGVHRGIGYSINLKDVGRRIIFDIRLSISDKIRGKLFEIGMKELNAGCDKEYYPQTIKAKIDNYQLYLEKPYSDKYYSDIIINMDSSTDYSYSSEDIEELAPTMAEEIKARESGISIRPTSEFIIYDRNNHKVEKHNWDTIISRAHLYIDSIIDVINQYDPDTAKEIESSDQSIITFDDPEFLILDPCYELPRPISVNNNIWAYTADSKPRTYTCIMVFAMEIFVAYNHNEYGIVYFDGLNLEQAKEKFNKLVNETDRKFFYGEMSKEELIEYIGDGLKGVRTINSITSAFLRAYNVFGCGDKEFRETLLKTSRKVMIPDNMVWGVVDGLGINIIGNAIDMTRWSVYEWYCHKAQDIERLQTRIKEITEYPGLGYEDYD